MGQGWPLTSQAAQTLPGLRSPPPASGPLLLPALRSAGGCRGHWAAASPPRAASWGLSPVTTGQGVSATVLGGGVSHIIHRDRVLSAQTPPCS